MPIEGPGGAASYPALRRLFIGELYSRRIAEIELWPSLTEAARRAVDVTDDLVVALPTSAGKTRVAEIATLMALASGKRVLIITPLRALSAQTTPEKLDFALRNDPTIIDDVGLVVLDAIQSRWRPTRQRFGTLTWQRNSLSARLSFDLEAGGPIRHFIPQAAAIPPRRTPFPRDNKELTLAAAWKFSDQGKRALIFCTQRDHVEGYAETVIDLHRRGFLPSLLNDAVPVQRAIARRKRIARPRPPRRALPSDWRRDPSWPAARPLFTRS